MENNKIHTLFLFAGRVEQRREACLVVHHNKGFDNLELALESLSKLLMKTYNERMLLKMQEKICTEHKSSSKAKFCSKCGKPKKVESEKPEDSVIKRIIYQYICGTADSNNWMWDDLYYSDWSFGSDAITKSSLSKGVVMIMEKAEEFLCTAYKGELKEEKIKSSTKVL